MADPDRAQAVGRWGHVRAEGRRGGGGSGEAHPQAAAAAARRKNDGPRGGGTGDGAADICGGSLQWEVRHSWEGGENPSSPPFRRWNWLNP